MIFKYFIAVDKECYNMSDTANCCNNFFVNVKNMQLDSFFILKKTFDTIMTY